MAKGKKPMRTAGFAVVLMLALGVLGYLTLREINKPALIKPFPAKALTAPLADGTTDYLRAVHWFGEAWSINHWNTQLEEQAKIDFPLIREDGFNTLILTVPWPGSVPNPRSGVLNEARIAQLERLLELASEEQLRVIMRLGYRWDSGVDNHRQWALDLWLDESVRRAWLSHLRALGALATKHGVEATFISWEDLWALPETNIADLNERIDLARLSGFQGWLQSLTTLDSVNARYGKVFADWSEIPIPDREEPAYGLFFDYLDHALIEDFFLPAQEGVPGLSMEIRVDSDPVWQAPGKLAYWHSHELAWELPGAPWTMVYWTPAMGGENAGEVLDAATAASRLQETLEKIHHVTGQRPIFLDQFRVTETSSDHETDGRLAGGQVGAFLAESSEILAGYTQGYALWTWKDYDHDALPSPDFFMANGGWDRFGPLDSAGESRDVLPRDGVLLRTISQPDFHVSEGPERAMLCIQVQKDGDPGPDLNVDAEPPIQSDSVDVSKEGQGCLELELAEQTTIVLEALRDLQLRKITLTGRTEVAGVRNQQGDLKATAGDWLMLNQRLLQPNPLPPRPLEDGWMGKSISYLFQGDTDKPLTLLQFSTHLPSDWPFQPTLEVRWNEQLLGTVPCAPDKSHEFKLPRKMSQPVGQRLTLTVDRTFRPDGDQRRLGCALGNLRAVQP